MRMGELNDDRPVMIFIARNPTEAHHAKGLLEAEGIFAEIRGEALFSAQGEIPIADSRPTLWVLQSDAERGRDVLKDYHSPRAEEVAGQPWVCWNCGEVLEGQFTNCWSCGSERRDI
jgi:hypothetical protein